MILLLLAPHVHAAEVEVRAGLEAMAVRDDLLVPMGFGGGGLRIGGAVAAPIGGSRFATDLDLGFSALANRYGHLAVSIGTDLEAGLTLPVAGTWKLGPAVVWDSRMSYLGDWDDAHGYWVGSLWLGPASYVTTRVGDGELSVSAAFAVVGAVGRPPTYRYDKQDPMNNVGFLLFGTTRGMEPATITSLQAVRADVAYGFPRHAERGPGWRVGLDSRLTRATQPELAVGMSTSAWVGASWGGR